MKTPYLALPAPDPARARRNRARVLLSMRENPRLKTLITHGAMITGAFLPPKPAEKPFWRSQIFNAPPGSRLFVVAATWLIDGLASQSLSHVIAQSEGQAKRLHLKDARREGAPKQRPMIITVNRFRCFDESL